MGNSAGRQTTKPGPDTMVDRGQAAGYKPKQGVLTRFISLAMLLIYFSVYAGWPLTVALVCRGPSVAAASMTCTCPMCTVDAKGVHHCSCCDHNDRCECSISSDSDDPSITTFLETGIPRSSRSLLPTLASDTAILRPVQLSADLELNVPTPPPKA